MSHILCVGLGRELVAGLSERLPVARLSSAFTPGEALDALGADDCSLLVLDEAALGPAAAPLLARVRAERPPGTLPVVCCVPTDADPEYVRRLVSEHRVSQLVFHPLDADVLAGRLAALLPAATAEPPLAGVELHDAVAALWTRHGRTLLQRVAGLEEVAALLGSGGADGERLRAARRDAHSLAGSLGMFGLGEGSARAAELEALLEESAPDPARARELAARLRRAVEERAGD